MAAAVAMYACLVVFSGLTAYEASEEPSNLVNGTVGATVYLNPTLSIPQPYHQINWLVNGSLKILSEKWNQPASYLTEYFNKSKLFYHANHSLEIWRLQKQDSGIYKIDVEDSQGRKRKENIQLDVYEPVPKPRVRVSNRTNQDGWCNVTLVCDVDATQVAYSWYQDGKYYKGKNSCTLDVKFKSQSDRSYKCIVSNPVSEAAGVIYYRSPCTWNEKSSAMPLSSAQTLADSILAFGFLLLIHNLV